MSVFGVRKDCSDLNIPKTSMSASAELCKIILKSMHKCASYGPDKLNL